MHHTKNKVYKVYRIKEWTLVFIAQSTVTGKIHGKVGCSRVILPLEEEGTSAIRLEVSR